MAQAAESRDGAGGEVWRYLHIFSVDVAVQRRSDLKGKGGFWGRAQSEFSGKESNTVQYSDYSVD